MPALNLAALSEADMAVHSLTGLPIAAAFGRRIADLPAAQKQSISIKVETMIQTSNKRKKGPHHNHLNS
jgi:hypothetical protein